MGGWVRVHVRGGAQPHNATRAVGERAPAYLALFATFTGARLNEIVKSSPVTWASLWTHAEATNRDTVTHSQAGPIDDR